MKGKKFLSMLVVLVLITTLVIPVTQSNTTVHAASVLTNFITRSGDKLMDGTQEFKFISFNIPNLHIVEDAGWHRIDPWEQEDAIKTIAQVGGLVTRQYCLSIKGGTNNGSGVSHVYGPGNYDENLFRDLDKLLEICNTYGVRIIIPFIDNWDWWGGIKHFAGFRGKTSSEFYTDAQVKQDFKDLISYVLNRTNYYTGVQYKNDKAILAWETGNELSPPDAWTSEMVAYIKSIDPNHLVMDGKYGISSASLTNSNIDIVSNHYYSGDGSDYAARCDTDRNNAKGKKVFYVGEFGLIGTSTIHALLDKVISNGTSGALIWSLRYHTKDGGFYWHQEGSTSYWSYHWPGFASGNGYDETNVVNLMRDHAYQIRGLSVPARTIPEAPVLLPISSVTSIKWKGSVGAEKYDIERAESTSGPWMVVGSNVLDSDNPYKPFNDTTVVNGKTYYYRAKAKNLAGTSIESNVVGPITIGGATPTPTPTPTATPTATPTPTAASITIDDFEGYGGSNSNLQAAYTRNPNGDSVTITLDTVNKNNGSYGMKFAYTLSTAGYCGETKNLGSANWSGKAGIKLWVKPDGTSKSLTIQFKESSGEYWEVSTSLSGSTATTIQLPFTSFAHPSWYSGGNGVIDLGTIAEYSIYLGGSGSGSIYFDSVVAY